jgi:hypothetical protein
MLTEPWEPGRFVGLVRIDALAIAFALLLALAGGVFFATEVTENTEWGEKRVRLTRMFRLLCRLVGCGALLLALFLTHVLAIAGAYVVAVLCLWETARRAVVTVVAVGLLTAGLVLIANQAGVWRYNLEGAGLGLNSLAFALLLAATITGSGLWQLVSGSARIAIHPLLLIAWHYPLLRLFSMGPWNEGWSLAALLLGGSAALWAVWRATMNMQPLPWLLLHYSGLALIGTGLASGLGVALALVSLACIVVLLIGVTDAPRPSADDRRQVMAAERHLALGLDQALLSPAIPFTLPFATLWLAISGAFAGGSSLLAALLWAGGLLQVLAVRALAGQTSSRWRLWLAASLSLLLGVTAPGWMGWLLQPIIGQLQAGLTPYGDVGLWPWAGLFALDAARQPVATLPSFALALLMLVIGALVWVGLRLWHWRRATTDD